MDSVGGRQYGPVRRIQRLAPPADKIRAYSPRVLLEADQPVPGPYRVGAEPLAYRPQQHPLELTPMNAELGIAESGLHPAWSAKDLVPQPVCVKQLTGADSELLQPVE